MCIGCMILGMCMGMCIGMCMRDVLDLNKDEMQARKDSLYTCL